ncbi:MAG: mechanosensitive ion channel [Rickettsiales bacterium]|jgi:small-conductance mechanosensitive channel|nr:mechanosensitive ion channel [Rickettsiales bacterium]
MYMRNFFAILFRYLSRRSAWLPALLLVILFLSESLGFLKQVENYFDSDLFAFSLGTVKLSLYKILKGIVALIALLWIAGILSAAGEHYLRRLKGLHSSSRSLFMKFFQAAVYLAIFLLALNILGIDLTTLAVFGGAVGIGVGFGLQKIASNFISGLILLMEKTVEEGDLIEMGDGITGFLRQTGARYTLLETFDGREVMIPNEDFITNRVVNWTYSNKKGRAEIAIKVAYGSDIKKAQALVLEAARQHPRCSLDPESRCYLDEFGESAITLKLYFWVDDVSEGRNEPRSDVMCAILEKFNANDIHMPFPQRDIYIKHSADSYPR